MFVVRTQQSYSFIKNAGLLLLSLFSHQLFGCFTFLNFHLCASSIDAMDIKIQRCGDLANSSTTKKGVRFAMFDFLRIEKCLFNCISNYVVVVIIGKLEKQAPPNQPYGMKSSYFPGFCRLCCMTKFLGADTDKSVR